ncbi:MAG: hypothetical protein ACLQU1_08105 [Bryobacteraceae bacterium]
MVTVCLVDIEAAVALNTAVVELAPTATEAGSTVNNAGLLAVNVTTTPPAGAAADSVTVQLVLVPEDSVVGEHVTLETVGGVGITVTTVVREPELSDAVTVTDWSVEIAAVVALNDPEVAAAATVTEEGTVRTLLLLERVTTAPPAGAAWVRVTVQALVELGPRLEGEQASEETSTEATRLMEAVPVLLL